MASGRIGRAYDCGHRRARMGQAAAWAKGGRMFKLGVILFPLMILAMILKQKGPVAKFLALGATSAEKARRTPELTMGERYQMPDLVKRGVLIALDDGRYYVDVAMHRRRRRRVIIVLAVAAVALVAAVVLLWPSVGEEAGASGME